MEDKRFSHWLKNPDVKNREEEDVRPKYHYHVIDLGNEDDVKKIKEEIGF